MEFRLALLSGLIIFLISCKSNDSIQTEQYGLSLISDNYQIKVWSPSAEKVLLNIYTDCSAENPSETLEMSKAGEDWVASLPKSYEGMSYSFQIQRNSDLSDNVVDPYAKVLCANGNRASFNLASDFNPEKWEQDKFQALSQDDQLLIYELHVKDFSISTNMDFEFPGKYKAIAEDDDILNHIASMGVSHIHLLPVFDFASIDELSSELKYNWGYDPQNYFAPEGSYAVEPNSPESRIKEFKEMVQNIHNHNMGVVMDVVYNHTYYLDNSSFQSWEPAYYYRQWEDGNYSNASACGNEIATEREKVRDMIVESLIYWMDEYHIDGFRFDLMGIMDTETMNELGDTLRKIKPNVLLYGEGWLAGNSPLPDSLRATKANMQDIPKIAAFSDEIRDGIKGHWSDEKDKGFVSGKEGLKASVKFGLVAGIEHSQIDYSRVNNSNFSWAGKTDQLISYVSCHDNHTLWDKLEISAPEFDKDQRRRMHLLALSMVLSSQGIPFFHAGTEFFRTKYGDHNSFESHDTINALHWNYIDSFPDEIQYLKDLIAFRQGQAGLNMSDVGRIQSDVKFLDTEEDSYIAMHIMGEEDIIFVFTPPNMEETFSLPEGEWNVLFSDFKAQEQSVSGSINLSELNCYVLKKAKI